MNYIKGNMVPVNLKETGAYTTFSSYGKQVAMTRLWKEEKENEKFTQLLVTSFFKLQSYK